MVSFWQFVLFRRKKNQNKYDAEKASAAKSEETQKLNENPVA